MNAQDAGCLIMGLLDERIYCVTEKRRVVCCLWRMTAKPPSPLAVAPVYAIGMESLTERYLFCVGSHGESARALFDRVVFGRLAPVHLRDVVEDYRWEREQLGKETGNFPESPLQ